MAQYSIRDIETLSGIKAHTLRVWEQRYAMLVPNRTETNFRYYTDLQLKQLLNISLLNKHGIKISKIAAMSEDEVCSEVLRLTQQDHTPDAFIDALILAMVDFDEARFEKTLQSAIIKLGFCDTYCQLIFPFLERTGVLWITGAVKPVQEHFISHLIRRKLCAAIDLQFVERKPYSRKFVLYLPEGEWHELLLLFSEYILRSHHHEVVYLGSSLPFHELTQIDDIFKPDYILTYFTIPPTEMPLGDYVLKLSNAFISKQVLIGGSQLKGISSLPTNMRHLTNTPDFKNFLADLQSTT